MFRSITFLVLFILVYIWSIKAVWIMSAQLAAPYKRIVFWSFILLAIVKWSLVIYLMSHRRDFVLEFKDYSLFNFAVGFFLILLFTQLILGSFHLINDLVNVFKFFVHKFRQSPSADSASAITRVQFFNQLGLGLSALWVGSAIYGVTRGKYAYRVLNEKLSFPHLPKSFDGLRIVQISDLHIGSFNENFEAVQEGFDLINQLDADYIFFTGDLVNNFSDEAEPWIDSLHNLKAKYGKFSILGNHDYGDYALGEFPDLKEKSFNRLLQIHEEAGFKLLRDENVNLERNGEKIKLIGCENWGLGFHQYGNLDKALEGTTEDEFKILLSHDPTHWQTKVIGETPARMRDEDDGPTERNIALTLSGHTHGAQFGVELPSLGIKFSAVQLRYKRWGGLYEKQGKYLYINRGFGFLAFPGRIGMPPEITLIELHTKA